MKLIILIVAVIAIAGHFVPISSKISQAGCVADNIASSDKHRVITGGLSSFKHLPSLSKDYGNTLDCVRGQSHGSQKAQLYLW